MVQNLGHFIPSKQNKSMINKIARFLLVTASSCSELHVLAKWFVLACLFLMGYEIISPDWRPCHGMTTMSSHIRSLRIWSSIQCFHLRLVKQKSQSMHIEIGEKPPFFQKSIFSVQAVETTKSCHWKSFMSEWSGPCVFDIWSTLTEKYHTWTRRI